MSSSQDFPSYTEPETVKIDLDLSNDRHKKICLILMSKLLILL